jgi:hypothetical protein
MIVKAAGVVALGLVASAAAVAAVSSAGAATLLAASPATGVLAKEDTKWKGVVAEVTEFRRKGNTLTAKVRLRNGGTAMAEPDVHYAQCYLMDAAAGKKYEVLKDEQHQYIAALRSGYPDRNYERIDPGEELLIWMKFPAPPATVKALTLQVEGVPPFDDLAIQDN